MGLDTVEFVIEVEKEFSIEISDDDASGLSLVGKLAEYIVSQTEIQIHQVTSFDIVFTKLQSMLVELYSIPKESILPTSHFVKDLGLD